MRTSLLLLLLAGACGGPTVGDQCRTIGDALCVRAVSGCHIGSTIQSCSEAFVAGCCGDYGICGDPADSAANSTIDLCVAEIRASSCGTIQAQQLPRSCSGAVRPR